MLSVIIHKDKVNCKNQAHQRCKMVPMKRLSLKENIGYNTEDDKRNDLLYNLQLHQGKRSAIAHEPDSVRRHLAAIFKESNQPREDDNPIQRPITANTSL